MPLERSTGEAPLGDPTGSVSAERAARVRAEAVERDASEAAERITRLQLFTAALSSAVTMRDVADVLSREGLDQFGAKAVGIVWMVAPGKLELVFGHGLTDAEFQALDAAARAGESLPIRDAIRSRQPVWLESPEEIRARYPILEPLRAARGESGCAVVPLVMGARCSGVIGFTFAEPHAFSRSERSFIEALAQLSAQAFERARLFEAEQAARRRAEHVTELQQQLLAVVGHDLRTPLWAIHTSATLLVQRGGLTADQASTISRIANSAVRMNAIIRDLLDFSRARQGLGISIQPERMDVGEVARAALVELEATRPGLQVSLNVRGDTSVDADPARIAQVISNLVGNALQHGAGAPVDVAITAEERSVVVEVSNHGAPISAEVLPNIFEPFRRGGPAAPEAPGGGSIGLGLFIVREIVSAHGGTVRVRSDAPSGTTFTVELPRAAAG